MLEWYYWRPAAKSLLLWPMKAALFLFFLVLWTESKGLLHWLENHLLACPFKQLTGVDCPGCGIQRSLLALFRGEWITSFKLYPATLPIIGLIVLMLVHLKFELKNGAFFLKFLYIVVTLIIVINYIYKIFTHQLI